jgi:hypothetical protein
MAEDQTEHARSEETLRLAKFWLDEIHKVDAEQRRWVKRGRGIEKRYRDERDIAQEEGQRKFNTFWANTQIMFPAIYGKCPVPVAERRFKDKDPVGRAAASIIERALRNDMEFDDFHESVGRAVLDYLLVGRGIVWVRYEPEDGEGPSLPIDGQQDIQDEGGDIQSEDEDAEEDEIEATGYELIKESCPVDYIHWEDCYCFPSKARIWREVRSVAKRVYMSRDELVDRFGSKKGKAVPLQRDDRERRLSAEGSPIEDQLDDKAHVFEIWDKDTLKVYWLADGYDDLLDEQADPLELDGFFPVPRPLSANWTNSTIIPIPDYTQSQDQYRQLDELTQRMSQLAKAVKVAGIYAGHRDELVRLLDENVENELIPVDNWNKVASERGIEGLISFLPIQTTVESLQTLTEVRKIVLEDLDRVTGMTDVMRGVTTDARETLGKGRLNNSNGKTRLKERQDEIARFCRDVVRIKGEIMSKHFSIKSLIEMSGILYEEGIGVSDLMDQGSATPSPPSVPPPQPQMTLPRPPMAQPGAPMPVPGGAAPPVPGQNVVPMPPHPMGGPSPLMAVMGKIVSAIKLLRDDYQRGFRIDIEVDSTIVADEEADKAARTEFIGEVTKFLEIAGQLAMANPQITPLLGKLLQFGVRGFRIGRDLEQSIEEFCDQAEQKAKQAASAPPPPNPEAIKAQTEQMKQQGELKRIQAQGQVDMQQAQRDQQTEAMRAKADQAQAQADIQLQNMRMEMEKMKFQMEAMKLQLEARSAAMDMQEHAARMMQPPQVRTV